jgi:hypothetical protein
VLLPVALAECISHSRDYASRKESQPTTLFHDGRIRAKHSVQRRIDINLVFLKYLHRRFALLICRANNMVGLISSLLGNHSRGYHVLLKNSTAAPNAK